MNYQSIYDQLINRASNRECLPNTFYERHHIIPKSFGGSNRKDNMVSLTLREHYVAHLLLVAIYPNSRAMHYALWNMCNITPNKATYIRHKPSSRIYNRVRAEYMAICRGENAPGYGKKVSEETKEKLRISLTGRKQDITDEERQRRSERMKHRLSTTDMASNALIARKNAHYNGKRGIPCPLVTRLKIAQSNIGNDRSDAYRSILQFDLQGVFLREWPGIVVASKELAIHVMGITQSCAGRAVRAGQYIWRYKDEYNGEPIICRRSNQKTVLQFDKEGTHLGTYMSRIDASNKLGINKNNIFNSIRYGYATNGFIFKYQN